MREYMGNNDPKYSRTAKKHEQHHSSKNHNGPRKRPVRRPKKKMSLFSKILLGLALTSLVCICSGATLFFMWAKDSPTLSEQRLASAGSTMIYDSDGNKIMSLGTENRSYVNGKDIPQKLKDAVTSIEDRRFYKHMGVDPFRIVAAALSNVSGSSAGLQGGSTLDQQLIKLSFFSTKRSDQTFKRKAQEAWLALKLDKTYSKDQILTYYVNKVFMGYGCYGMQTAAKYYYGKTLDQLDLAQTALIAGIPNAPSQYNPYSNPTYAKARRDEVLNAMAANDKISSQEAASAKNEDVKNGLLQSHQKQGATENEKIADPYIKQVVEEVKDKGYDPYKGSLQIYTNLNMNVQKRLYEIANTDSYLSYPDDELQVASTVIDPKNGNVVAMIGGRKNGNVTFGLNRAVQTDRTNGSTAKPLMDYGPAIEYLSWATYKPIKDTKYIYPGTNIQLYDFDHEEKGTMTMRNALIQSRNIPAIRALEAVGITKSQAFIEKLGFKYKKTLEFQNGIGMPSSTLQNAAAYAAFANEGIYHKPQYINTIITADGESKKFASSGKQAMQPSTAYMITDMLKQVITEGTGTRAAISGLYQAGKTGTNAYPSDIASKFPSSSSMDSWFNGYTKHYSVSVWVGYDHQYENGNYLDRYSQSLASLFYKAAMTYLSQGKTNTDWSRPSNVYVKEVNGVRELYLAGSSSQTVKDEDGDSSSISSLETTSSVLSSTSSSSSSEETSSSSSESSSDNVSTSSSSSSATNSSPTNSKSSTEKTGTEQPGGNLDNSNTEKTGTNP